MPLSTEFGDFGEFVDLCPIPDNLGEFVDLCPIQGPWQISNKPAL